MDTKVFREGHFWTSTEVWQSQLNGRQAGDFQNIITSIGFSGLSSVLLVDFWIVRSPVSLVKWPVHNHLLLCFVSFDISISCITLKMERVLSFIPFIPHSVTLRELRSSGFLSWHRCCKCTPTSKATGPSDGTSLELCTVLARAAESLITCAVMNW